MLLIKLVHPVLGAGTGRRLVACGHGSPGVLEPLDRRTGLDSQLLGCRDLLRSRRHVGDLDQCAQVAVLSVRARQRKPPAGRERDKDQNRHTEADRRPAQPAQPDRSHWNQK